MVSTPPGYLERLDASLGARSSPHTRRAWRGQAARFLAFCGTKRAYSRAEVLAYVDSLIRKGQKRASIEASIKAIRALFKANEIPWPLDERIHLGMPDDEADAPALSPEDMVKLICAVRGVPGLPRATVALATIYGLRGDEIARVLAAGCDGVLLEVQTAKGGRRRSHAIPPPLAPAFRTAPIAVSTRYLHDLFERLMAQSVRPPVAREGWHSARRAVVTALLQSGIPEIDVRKWMGWRYVTSIAERYYKPDRIALDRQIMDRHPYVRAWLSRGDGTGGRYELP